MIRSAVRRSARHHLALTLVVAAVVAALPAAAQQRLVVVGVVQWVASNRVQLMSDAGVSVNVDMSRVDQAAYTSLRGGDRISVVGVVSPDRRWLIAESVQPAGAGGGWWSIFPQAG